MKFINLNTPVTILAVIFLCLASISTHAQIKTVTIATSQIGTVSCNYESSINLDRGDTLTYFYLGFQNAKYSSITDIVSIFMPVGDSSKVYAFIKDLTSAYAEMGTKADISWNKDDYSIYLYDFNTSLYLGEPSKNGSGYTTLTKKQVAKLLLWFVEVGYNKV